jgi:hypothetical protein
MKSLLFKSSLILTIPEDFIPIASFIDMGSQLALAHTCRMLCEYRKRQCKKQTFTVLYDSPIESFRGPEYIKIFERYMNHTGWIAVKVTIETALMHIQNDHKLPIRSYL